MPVQIRYTRTASLRLLLLALAFVASCGGDGADVEKIVQVGINPTGTIVLSSLNETVQLSALALDGSGGSSPVSVADVTWTSDAPAVASVSAAGLVAAVSNGDARVTAEVAGADVVGVALVAVEQAAASVTVTLDPDNITVQGTSQAAISAVDAGGSPLAAPDPAWSSSDPAVAMVSSNGVVTGIGDGEAQIVATLNGVSGEAALTVIRPDLILEDGAVVGGVVIVRNFTVPAGATVTLGADLQVDAGGVVSVAGALVGDCLEMALGGSGSIDVSGTLDNSCASQVIAGEAAPALVLDAPGGVELTDATLISSGPVTVQSLGGAVGVARYSGQSATGAQATTGTVSLDGTTILAEPTEVPQPTDAGAPAPNGAEFAIRADIEVIIDGATVRTQHGGPGQPVSGTSAESLDLAGGPGGNGGDVVIDLPAGGFIRFRSTRGVTQLIAGNGGPGGPVTATTTQNGALHRAPSATSVGGDGGKGGTVVLRGSATLQDGSELSAIVRQVGRGGSGGFATSVAADGVAASDRDAQSGGGAEATGGSGGNAGRTVGTFIGIPEPDAKEGGPGGVARATAGRGGDGIPSRPNGAGGGFSIAFGGRGGDGTNTAGRVGADAIADGGVGGNGAGVCEGISNNSLQGQISVLSDPASSDPFIFDAGSGQSLFMLYRVFSGSDGPGGDGGTGGFLGAARGLGGSGRNVQAAPGVGTVGSGGNGGNGGEGVPGGAAGVQGSPHPDVVAPNQLLNPVFQDGQPGPTCASSRATPSRLPAPLMQAADVPVEISGNAPFVTVTGTLSPDGTVTASGRGTVAGVDDVLVEFSGTWDETAQTLSGTYTIDSEKVIDPDHPVVYQVSGTKG